MSTQYTPNMALPYPENADVPAGDEQMQALAEAVDAYAAPVRRDDLVFSEGYQADPTRGAGYFLAWGRVWLDGEIKTTSGSVVANAYLATLPEEIWPASLRSWSVGMGAGVVGYLNLSTAGVLQIVFNVDVWPTPGNYVSLDGCSYYLKAGA